jgi:hypothetical protein
MREPDAGDDQKGLVHEYLRLNWPLVLVASAYVASGGMYSRNPE